MKQSIQSLFKNETFVAALLILVATVITYGVSIPKLGYYHDDWFVLWSGQMRGAESIIPLFSSDRPFMGVIYSFIYRLLGDSIANWHLYALLWRFIGGLAFFWILRLIWPEHKYITTMMAILFVVYPGFLSQPNANTKQNHLYGFATALLSIALMLQAMKVKTKGLKIAGSLMSILLTANYLFIYEYMIGFEGTRIILLGYVLFQNGFRQFYTLVREISRRIWPYLLVTASFLYWRVFIFEGARNATDASGLAESYLSNFRYMSIRLTLETVKDFLDTSIFAWFVEPYQLFSAAPYANLIFAFLVSGTVVGLVLLYTTSFKRRWGTEYNEAETPRLMTDFTWIGAVFLRYPDGARGLPGCWLWHPHVIEELLWLRRAWISAYTGAKSSPAAVGDWHDRLRPGVARRIQQTAGTCSVENHQPGRTPLPDPHAATGGVRAGAAVEPIAFWWAVNRDAEPPTPSSEQLTAAAESARPGRPRRSPTTHTAPDRRTREATR